MKNLFSLLVLISSLATTAQAVPFGGVITCPGSGGAPATCQLPSYTGGIKFADGSIQTSSAGTAPLSMGAFDGQPANSTGATITSNMLFMQSADATHPGEVNTGAQTFSGNKTFTGNLSAPLIIDTGLTPSTAVFVAGGSSLVSQAVTGAGNVVMSNFASMISPTLNGAVTFTGATSGSTTLKATAVASGALTLPAATDTLVGKATTDTFTNKTLSTGGTNLIGATAISGTTGSTNVVFSNAPSLTGNIGIGSAAFNGTGSSGTYSLPNVGITDTLVSRQSTDTLTNKSIATAGATNYFGSTPIFGVTGTNNVVMSDSPSLLSPSLTGTVSVPSLSASSPVFTDGSSNLTSTGTVPVAKGGTGVTSLSNFTDSSSGADGITVTGGTAAVVVSTSIAQQKADATHNGYLSSGDWTTFNNKLSSTVAAPVGSSPNANGLTITSGGGVSTFTLQPADASNPGVVSTGSQTFAGAKTFSGTTLNGTTTVDSFTAGSIPYIGASSALTQDNANLFWDATNKRLGVAKNSPVSALDVNGQIRLASAADIGINDNSTFTSGMGGFHQGCVLMNSGMSTLETYLYGIGRDTGVNNASYFGFNYSGISGSPANYATIGFYGNDHILNMTAARRVGIDITNPSGTLHVQDSGSTQTNPNMFLEMTGSNLLVYKSGTASTMVENTAGGNLLLQASIAGGRVGVGETNPPGKLSVLDSGSNQTNPNLHLEMTGANLLVYNNGTSQARIENTGGGGLALQASGAGGNVGINTTAADNTLTVNGTADKPGGGSWGTFSDARLKNVGRKYTRGIEAVSKLNPVFYRYKEENPLDIDDDDEHVGFVAQDVEKVIPEAITYNEKGYRLLNNDPIIWAMLNSIKVLKKENDAMKSYICRQDPNADFCEDVR